TNVRHSGIVTAPLLTGRMHVPRNSSTTKKHGPLVPPRTTADTGENAIFGYSFPAIRGIQAGREYYASMCPLRIISKVFTFDNEELPPELRAQRSLNKGRLPEITR